MEKYYQSLTMGNIVDAKREAIAQIFESLFKYHTFDFKWKKITETKTSKEVK